MKNAGSLPIITKLNKFCIGIYLETEDCALVSPYIRENRVYL